MGTDKEIKVDKELIRHIAESARIRLTETEIKRFSTQLKEILNAFSQLDKVNTDNTKPSFQPVEMKNMLREDKVKESLTQEEALSNAKEKKEGYFKGPMAV
ncbi:Asp-tRNA(Asn)/Glu-tRNA(Gln) amidotransferase subunit GatC [Candidatus Woesearchaeota archaeon]|nr:Asp-tRNA(Asn)/Glu-tRNA(Gln) amidotransferase subunit GatC [Candidatus Woesearchaeota archaeon]